MSKVLLIYDDYSLLSQTQSSLKKMGFDAIGVSSEIGLSEQIISFNPDAVVAYGSGTRVNSLSVGRRLKDMVRWQGKSILIFPQNGKPNGQDLIQARADLILEFPVPMERMLGILARFLGTNEAVMLERFRRSEQASAEQALVRQNQEPADIFVRSREPDAESDPFQKAMDNWVRKAPAVGGEEAPSAASIAPKVDSPSVNPQSTYVQGGISARQNSGSYEDSIGSATDSSLPDNFGANYGSPESAKARSVESTSQALAKDSFQHPSSADPDLAEAINKVARDLVQSKLQAKERVLRYADKMENLKLSKESTITRKKAKIANKEMNKDWKQDDLDHLDKLRREFTAAMFKKK